MTDQPNDNTPPADEPAAAAERPKRRKTTYHPAVGPKLTKLLAVVFALFSILAVNSAYLATITALQHQTGQVLENTFYLGMFLLHLGLGLIMIAPVVVFGFVHMVKARQRPNRRAVRESYQTTHATP